MGCSNDAADRQILKAITAHRTGGGRDISRRRRMLKIQGGEGSLDWGSMWWREGVEKETAAPHRGAQTENGTS